MGEATLSPATYSLLPDYFRREELGLATGIFASGVTIGGGLAMLIGGMAVQALQAHGNVILPVLGLLRPWQAAFLVVGTSGLAVALLVTTIREPGRGSAPKARTGSMGEALAWLRRHRNAFAKVFIGYSLMVVPSYALVTWVPTFLSRSHGMGPAAIGGALGSMMLLGGTAGMLAGGVASDRLARRGHGDAPLRVCLFAIIAQAPPFVAAMLVEDTGLCLALLTVSIFLLSLCGGLQGATVQAMAPPQIRGQAIAAYLLCANLIGLGLGPAGIALLTDRVLGDPLRLGEALALTSAVVLPLAALLVFLALAPARRTIAEATGITA